jgi:hypothetical protein
MSKAPVHIMRFAPADYLMDGFVKGCYRRRDYRTVAFYSAFLFRSHLEGGSLEDDETALADHLGMSEKDVRDALAACVAAGKLKRQGGRVFHHRVVESIEAEMQFRAEQTERGKLGGRPAQKAKAFTPVKPVVVDAESPPSPLPTPSPAPSPDRLTPAPEPGRPEPVGSKRSPFLDSTQKRQDAEREALKLCGEIAERDGRDAWEVMGEAAHYQGAHRQKFNPASMSDDRLLATLADLKATLAHLRAKPAAVAR